MDEQVKIFQLLRDSYNEEAIQEELRGDRTSGHAQITHYEVATLLLAFSSVANRMVKKLDANRPK